MLIDGALCFDDGHPLAFSRVIRFQLTEIIGTRITRESLVERKRMA